MLKDLVWPFVVLILGVFAIARINRQPESVYLISDRGIARIDTATKCIYAPSHTTPSGWEPLNQNCPVDTTR